MDFFLTVFAVIVLPLLLAMLFGWLRDVFGFSEKIGGGE